MIHASRGIVLNHIKYKENSIIVNIYTEELGRQAYVVNRVRTSKSKGNTVLLQPLTLLDMQVYHRPKAELHRIKDFKVAHPQVSIPFQQDKRTIAFFLTEMMYKVLREEEKNEALFAFIYEAIMVFDADIDGNHNFHLFFLFQLSRFLGFGPASNDSVHNSHFDLLNGNFIKQEPTHGYFVHGDILKYWEQLFKLQISDLSQLQMSSSVRNDILNALILFYQLHLDGLGEFKTLSVLRQLYNNPDR
ncbi:DNA repair protein RecO [Carboxylicivirga sp. N1Y90]|uniref:DNA repair protein RecO n=1 Tax=Carboxylicivirga fragile TaxID=3417571 RepID=UPI003D3551E1|nr:DNA repair protein RecO [Marinilabiliaceae bacterium N1Y90]